MRFFLILVSVLALSVLGRPSDRECSETYCHKLCHRMGIPIVSASLKRCVDGKIICHCGLQPAFDDDDHGDHNDHGDHGDHDNHNEDHNDHPHEGNHPHHH